LGPDLTSTYRIVTVTKAATAFDLTLLDTAKADLRIEGDDEARDKYLSRVIRQVTASVQQFCNRVFALQSYEEVIRPERDRRPYLLPNGSNPLGLSKKPLIAVTAVTENGVALVAGTDYEVDFEAGFLYRLDGAGNPCLWPSLKIVVDYDAGYVLPATDRDVAAVTLPADLEDAAIRLVKARFLAQTRDPYLKADEVAGIGRQEFWIAQGDDGNMPPDVTDILENYRTMVIA
jgi:hypothetical protein